MSMGELINGLGTGLLVLLGTVYVLIGSWLVAAEREDRRRRAAVDEEVAI